MFLGFQKELFHGAPHRSCKKVHTGDGIVKFDGLLFFLNGLEKLGCLPVPSVLSVVAIKVANPIGGIKIAIPPQVLLNGFFGSSVRLGRHDVFLSHDGKLARTRTEQLIE